MSVGGTPLLDSTSRLYEPAGDGKCRFAIDRGGTFTDVFAETPHGEIAIKLLSVDPANYDDAPREGIRRVLDRVYGTTSPKNAVPTEHIEWIRMGTTVATNALLERKGAPTALAITAGFRDMLKIGTQARPGIFDLSVAMPELLYSHVVEIEERVRLLGAHEDTSDAVAGRSGEYVEVLEAVDDARVREQLRGVYDAGYRSLAVVLMHSYTYDAHERAVKRIAEEVGLTMVSMSSELMPMIKMVPRGLTSCVDGYLTPLIMEYIRSFKSGFVGNLQGVTVEFMQSDGGLTNADRFNGFRAILSGPAGGVVGVAKTTYNEDDKKPVIGFDMGGTSTDVSRFSGEYDHVFETTTAGVIIQAPQLDITTVAAGGGSLCMYKQGRFVVGPESAGAHPGPVCYRKHGKLAITDANLALGRIIPEFFPKIFGPEEDLPLDRDASAAAFVAIAEEIKAVTGQEKTPEEVAYGFIEVANEAMCRPIRGLTEARGFSTAEHVLACFGGAAGQHACAIARDLGMDTVFVHRYSGILSAYGIGLAEIVVDEVEPAQDTFDEACADTVTRVENRLAQLHAKVVANLGAQGFEDAQISTEAYLNLRYHQTGTSIMVRRPERGTFRESFEAQYVREYGFTIHNRPLILDDIRVRGTGAGVPLAKVPVPATTGPPVPLAHHKTYFKDGWLDTPVYTSGELRWGDVLEGPAVIMQDGSTVIVEPGCTAHVTEYGDLKIAVGVSVFRITAALDPISLSIFSHRFMSIAEQMGRALQRTAISTNIKERLDFSCALFGPDGGLVANAPHIPVHLGAMGATVRQQKTLLGEAWREGDVIVTNCPLVGGSHLPDITVITPVFFEGRPVFYVACRGHHADIGGTTPGSIPPFSKHLSEEGAHITSFKLVEGGVFQEQGITDLLMEPGKHPGMSGTRTLSDNLADLRAQVAANQRGIKLMHELIDQYGLDVVQAYMHHIQENAGDAVRGTLAGLAAREGKVLGATDYMDDGSEINLKITIDPDAKTAEFDFTGTTPQVHANHNCPTAVCASAIIYALRCLVDEDIPLNQGCMHPIAIHVPPGTLLSPTGDCAVVGGNVLTSQRVTDVVLQAFNACADSQGDTNNVTFGDDTFGYYETVSGGAGAGRTWDGTSGVHTHMTNTRITDAEILERRYPVLLTRFHLRGGSGGAGVHPGGDGVVREIMFLKPLSVGILSERRVVAPHGRGGGADAKRGRNTIVLPPAASSPGPTTVRDMWAARHAGSRINFGGKNGMDVQAGTRLIVETPGGGGWGAPQA